MAARTILSYRPKQLQRNEMPMRCADLSQTWTELSSWFDRNGVLVLPPLSTDGPSVRLDADADPSRNADPVELERQLGRLRTLIEHFGVRAVYVSRDEQAGLLTIQVMAGGVVHQLMLVADWYADFLDETIGMAPMNTVP
jgi:hypothetical protein